MVARHVNKKNAGKPRFFVFNALLHSLAALAASFSGVAFYCYFTNSDATAKVNLARIQCRGYPILKRLHGKISPRLRGLPGLPHLSCKRDQIKIRDCMDRRVTPPKRVTSPTWGPPPPCKQALSG